MCTTRITTPITAVLRQVRTNGLAIVLFEAIKVWDAIAILNLVVIGLATTTTNKNAAELAVVIVVSGDTLGNGSISMIVGSLTFSE